VEESAHRVVIAGGGIAGLEALICLHELAADRLDLTLLAPEPDFTYRPFIVEEPFSLAPAERRELAPVAAEFGARLTRGALAAVDATEQKLKLADGSELPFDSALVCIGARPVAALPSALTIVVSREPPSIDGLLRSAAEHHSKRLALVVPPGVGWPLPIYELALMAERRARALDLGLECAVLTPESAPLIMFGRIASDAVAELLRARGIRVRTGVHVREVDGELVMTPGDERFVAGEVIALPVLEGPALPGLPADEGGFIPIDQHARVDGLDGVYAAGDGTNFPIKQGGIGTQEADAAAEHIASRAGAPVDPKPFHPVLRGQLLTGEESLSISADVGGGAGEGIASPDYLWWPPHKVAGRYLAPWLEGEHGVLETEPPRHPLAIEVSLPHEWHREPMALDPYEPLVEE
jgi:sulfide:quinone oxidoreductase